MFYIQTRKRSIGHGEVKIDFYVTSLTITKLPKRPTSTQSPATWTSSTTRTTKRKVNFLIYLLCFTIISLTWHSRDNTKRFSDYKSFWSLIFLRSNVKWLTTDPHLSVFCFDSNVLKKYLSNKRLLKFSWRHYLLSLSKGRMRIRRSAVIILNKKHYFVCCALGRNIRLILWRL